MHSRIMRNTRSRHLHGRGIWDVIKRGSAIALHGYNKAKELYDKHGQKLLLAQKVISNLAPSSDENARPLYDGEMHAMLKLPNGKMGRANYVGPGTQIEKRLARGDPPRSYMDKVAQAHDIRYGLAQSQGDVEKADKIFINAAKKAQEKKLDNDFNINMGLRPIQAKYLAEKAGIVQHGKIAEFGGINEANRPMLQSKLAGLEMEGVGVGLPADKLKARLLKQLKRKKQVINGKGAMTARGLTPAGGGLKLAGQGLHLAGGAFADGLVEALHREGIVNRRYLQPLVERKDLRAMLNIPFAASRDGADIVGTGRLKQSAKALSDVLLPILHTAKIAQHHKQLRGRGIDIKGLLSKVTSAPIALRNKFMDFILDSIVGMVKRDFSHLSGSGLYGGSFWSGFKDGFMKIWRPILDIAPKVAPLIPMLL